MKLYARIPHLPGSRRTAGEPHSSLARRMLEHSEPGDTVWVQEKLDGTCVGVCRQEGVLRAYGREGRSCELSRNANRRAFAHWLEAHTDAFAALCEGERLMLEWLAVAHGTRYVLPHVPLVVLDLFDGRGVRQPLETVQLRLHASPLPHPHLLHRGGALPLAQALERLGPYGFHGAQDRAEGLIYRLERSGVQPLLAKYVRPDKQDGWYLADQTGATDVYNTWPESGGHYG